MDAVGIGVAQRVEDVQSLLPGVAGRGDVPAGLVRFGESGQRGGFEIAVAELPPQVDCSLVIGDGVAVVAEMAVDVGEAVQGGGLTVMVDELLLQGQGLLTVGEGLLVVAK